MQYQNGKFFLQEQAAAEKLGESDDTGMVDRSEFDKDRGRGRLRVDENVTFDKISILHMTKKFFFQFSSSKEQSH